MGSPLLPSLGYIGDSLGDASDEVSRWLMFGPKRQNQAQTDALLPKPPVSKPEEFAGPPANQIQTKALGGEVPKSHIRFQLPGGEWKEYNSGGSSREERLGQVPEMGPPAPPDGGANV